MLVSVAVPVPFLPLLTYRVPPGTPTPARGTRVLVPLGRRAVTGLVTGPADDAGLAEGAIRDLSGVLDEGAPFLPDAIVDLALWVAEYYLAGPGEALSTAMPPFAWVESQQRYELTAAGATAAEAERDESRARILRTLARGPK